MKIVFPVIKASSGSDVYYENLCDSLKKIGMKAEIKWMNYKTEFSPRYRKRIQKDFGNFDVIHTNSEYGCFFNCPGSKLTITLHHNVFEREYQKYTSIFQKMYHYGFLKKRTQRAMNGSERIVSVSRATKNSFESHFQVPEKKIITIHNGIDEKIFKPRKVQSTGTHRKLIFVGNLSKRKGIDVLSKAMRKLGKEYSLVCVSKRAKNIKFDKNIEIVSNISKTELVELYNNADMLIFPSRLEGFGYTVAEAMACGLPVVASNCSSIPELIDNGKGGFLCPVGDVDAFAEKINILSHSPTLRKEMGEYNRAKVEKMFTLDRMVNDYKRLFEEVMDNKS